MQFVSLELHVCFVQHFGVSVGGALQMMYNECSLCLHVDKYAPIASYTVTVLHEVNLMPNYTVHSNNEACSVFFANAQSVQGRISLNSVKHS